MPKPPKTPDSVAITIGGKRRRLRYCARSITLAGKLHGLSLSDVLPPTEEVDGVTVPVQMSDAESMDANMRLVWFGLLAYEPELTQEQMEMEMGWEEMEPAIKSCMRAFKRFMPSAFADDVTDEAVDGPNSAQEPPKGEAKAVAA